MRARRPGLPDGFRLVLDPGTRRLDGGRVLLGGSPLRLLRLSAAGARLLDRLLADATVAEASAGGGGAGSLARRLTDAGAAHPRPPAAAPDVVRDVAVVIPVRDRASGLARLLATFAVDPSSPTAETVGGEGRFGGDGREVVVVDDGSVDGSGEVARRTGARVIRHDRARGPAAARNAGAAATGAPLVAFVDSDCLPEPGWLAPVVAHFADPLVGAVAPRVGGRRLEAGTALARYESVRTPLDLGPAEGPVRPRSRVPYVPAAALVVRREAFVALGGFDEALHFGEDVDLVWRMAAAGWVVRYEPAARVGHDHRVRLGPLLARRAAYGSAAAPLARRHPGALAPLQVSAWSLAAWALAAAGRPLAGAAVAGASAALLPRKLEALEHPWAEAARLAGVGHLVAGRFVADAVLRAWLPVALAAAATSRRARRALGACAVVPAILDWRRRSPALDPVRFVALRLLDDAAYCAGVWRGCLAERTVAPLVPDLSSWPGRRTPGVAASGPTPPPGAAVRPAP